MANRKVVYDIEAEDKTGQATKSATMRFTELNSAIEIGSKVWQGANDIYKATIETFVKYADQVRTLRDITGESSEEMSRVIQLTDDYKISSEKLTMVQKTLAAQGKSLNINMLAQMSDEYLALNSGTERQLYLTKNLGREGADYAEILRQGSGAIRDQANAINEYLILGDEQLQQARDLEIAQDNLNDTWQAFVYRVGPGLTEKLTALIQLTTDFAEADQTASRSAADFINRMLRGTPLVTDYAEELMKAKDAAKRTAFENKELALETAKAAIAFQDMISITSSLTTAENSYQTNVEANNAELLTLMEERARLKRLGYTEESQQIRDIDAKLDINAQKAGENADAHELATRRIVLSYAQQLLAADGLTQEEAEFLLQKGVEWGIYSETAVEEMQSVITEAGLVADAINDIPTDHTITITTVYVNSGGGGSADVNTNETQAAGGSGIVPAGFTHDNFLVGLSSGEKYSVTPSSRVGASEKGGEGGGGNSYTFVANGITNPDEFLRWAGQKVKQQGGLPQ